MKRKYAKDRFSERMILLGMVMMILSLIISTIHVHDIEDTYLSNNMDQYVKQISSFHVAFVDECKLLSEQLDVLSSKIESSFKQNASIDDSRLLLDILNEDVRYDAIVKLANGEEYSTYDSLYLRIAEMPVLALEYNETVQVLVIQDLQGEEETFLSIQKILMDDDVELGTVEILYDLSNFRNSALISNMLNEGFCYLTDYLHESVAMDSLSENSYAASTSFESVFLETVGESSDSGVSLSGLYSELQTHRSGARYIELSNGNYYLLAYHLISREEGTFLMGFYDATPVIHVINQAVFRTALSSIVIVTMSLILLLFVWVTSMNTTTIIEKMAYEDEITRGKNLNYFKVRAHEILETNRGIPYLVERFDIANFRYINEAYGHDRADELLRACVSIAKDIFLSNEICARMHSDQFVVLVNNDSGNKMRWEDYRQSVNEYARTIGIKFPIRFKVGIYQIREYDREVDMMIDRANAARKMIKTDSKSMTRVYSDSIVDEMRRIDRIESDMQRALQEKEFQVYLQQKWNADTDELYGAEALIRWIKPEGTVIFPSEFIPLFETNGFIENIDYYVLETVCEKQKQLLDAGKKCVPISVNQSKVLLNNSDYVLNVARIIDRYEIPKELITLEITESVFLNDEKAIEKIVNDLKEIGVLVSMDDFGSGYSSLNLLKDIPFDVIKIDRGFASDSMCTEKSRLILQKIIEMTQGIGMSVICEGIETKEQLESITNLGCSIIQGYYYGKPIPMDEFCEKYLGENC